MLPIPASQFQDSVPRFPSGTLYDDFRKLTAFRAVIPPPSPSTVEAVVDFLALLWGIPLGKTLEACHRM